MAWHWSDQTIDDGTDVPAGSAGGAIAFKLAPAQSERAYAFVRAPDRKLWVNWWTGSDWSWSNLGTPSGQFVDARIIAAVTMKDSSSGPTRPYAFMRGSDGQLWSSWWDSTGWHWSAHGTPTTPTSQGFDHASIAAVTVRDSDTVAERPHVFVRGANGHLWLNSWQGTHWRWSDLGQPSSDALPTGRIAAIAVEGSPGIPSRPHAIVRAKNGVLWVNALFGSERRWESLGLPPLSPGATTTSFAAITIKDSRSALARPHVFAGTSDGRLCLCEWTGSRWEWSAHGDPPGWIQTGQIAAVGFRLNPGADEQPYAFVRTHDGHMWSRFRFNGRWEWADHGTAPRATIAEVISATTIKDDASASTRPYVFVRGADGHLWLNRWDGR